MQNKFFINFDQDKLCCTEFFPEDQKTEKGIIFLNGSGGTKERFYPWCEYFAPKGYHCVCFDFRGRGESETHGIASLNSAEVDLNSIISNLEQKGINNLKLIGTSMGADIAARVGALNPSIKQMILIAPAAFKSDYDNCYYLDADKTFHEFSENDMENAPALINISNFKGKLDIVRLEKDNLVPEWLCQGFYNNAINSDRKTHTVDSVHSFFKYNQSEKVFDLVKKLIK